MRLTYNTLGHAEIVGDDRSSDVLPAPTVEALPLGGFKNGEGIHGVLSSENYYIHNTTNPSKPPIDPDAPAAPNVRRAEIWLDDGSILYELQYGSPPSAKTLAAVIALLPAGFHGKRVVIKRLAPAKM